MWQLCGYDRVDIALTAHNRTILKIVKSTCNGIKKNQMNAYGVSYKRQLYLNHTVAT
jgi:hypothetical protein